jgi:hypothetical protein
MLLLLPTLLSGFATRAALLPAIIMWKFLSAVACIGKEIGPVISHMQIYWKQVDLTRSFFGCLRCFYKSQQVSR